MGKQRQKAHPRKEPQTAQLPESSDDDTNHCFKCGGVYLDTEVHEWVGCDSCYRWFHFKCAGFKGYPRKQNSLYATYVKINILNLGPCFSNNLYPTNV